MNLFKSSLLTAAVFISLGAAQAGAEEVFKWAEPHTQFAATFPDDWRQIGDQQPDDVLTIAAPGENDYATCRLRRREDRRFLVFPREFASAIQHKGYGADFWTLYLGEYAGFSLNEGHDDAGLGQAFATYADASYVTSAGPKVLKRGIMLGGNYNDKTYIFECSADQAAFDKWHGTFLDILKSVDFRTEYSTRVNGYYRPFQDDGKIKIFYGDSHGPFIY